MSMESGHGNTDGYDEQQRYLSAAFFAAHESPKQSEPQGEITCPDAEPTVQVGDQVVAQGEHLEASQSRDAPVESAEKETPESLRAAVYAECTAAIDACLDEAVAAGPEGTQVLRYVDENIVTTREITLVRSMIGEAVRDDDPTAVATYVQRLRELPHVRDDDLREADFAAAIMGDEAAADAIHHALRAERDGIFQQREYERGGQQADNKEDAGSHAVNATVSALDNAFAGPDGAPPRPEPLPQSLHHTIIRRCVDYGIPAENWINTYALDPQDQWGKMTEYLTSRTRAVDADQSPPDLQEAIDTHAARLFDMPDAYVVQHLPDIAEHIENPQLVQKLIEKYNVLRSEMTPAYDLYLGSARVALVGLQRIAHISAEQAVETIDRWTGQVLSVGDPQDSRYSMFANKEMHLRDRRLQNYAEHFAQQGDFVSAQQLVSAIPASRDARYYGRQRLLQMASEPSHLEPFAAEDISHIIDSGVDVDLEVATMRITKNTEGLISRAVEHLTAIVEVDDHNQAFAQVFRATNTLETPQGDAARMINNGRHVIYAELAYEALKQADRSQLPAMARRVLPILRAQRRDHHPFAKGLSEALIADGDAAELRTALADALNASPPNISSSTTRESRAAALWTLARQIKRASRVA